MGAPASNRRERGSSMRSGVSGSHRRARSRPHCCRKPWRTSRRSWRVEEPEWYSPATLDEAIALKVRLGDTAVVVGGGTFTGILVGNGLIRPEAFIHLAGVPGL